MFCKIIVHKLQSFRVYKEGYHRYFPLCLNLSVSLQVSHFVSVFLFSKYNEDDLKNEDSLKNEENPKKFGHLKNEDSLKKNQSL